jgi:putative cell wall-binding protein
MKRSKGRLRGYVRKALVSVVAGVLAASFAVPTAAIADSGDLTVALVDATATPVDLKDGTVANYLLLSVDASDDYTTGTYTIDAATPNNAPVVVEATPVLRDAADAVIRVKVPVPAGVIEGTLTVNDGSEVLAPTAFAATTAGVAAPATIYGTTSMAFSEYYYDVTAAITDVQPATTVFKAGDTVATPLSFITAGTRYQWPANDLLAKVDAISSATYGDAVHFIPTGNYVLNYDPATTQGEGHAATGIASVDVGIAVDLLANATLLGAANDQSAAILAKVAGVSRVAPTAIYKAKYLRTDAGWGPREATPTTAAAASPWPGSGLSTSISYGGGFTNREVVVNFTALPDNLTANAAALLWDDYLNNLYGGYVEDHTGHKEPLVWLQNLFTHKAHTNFEVSINSDIFGRFAALDLSQPVDIVVYAKGLEDIALNDILLKAVVDNNAVIEQGATHYIVQDDDESWFEDGQLHISGLSTGTLDAFTPTNAAAQITKGGTAIDSNLYTIEKEGAEIAVSFDDAFFTSPTAAGAYTITLLPQTDSSWYKTFNFTVNYLFERPTLAVAGSGAYVATAADPVTVPQGAALTFSDDTYAAAASTAGRGGSTIADVTAAGATTPPAITDVLTRDGAGQPYRINTAILTVGHTYRINLVTTNIGTKADEGADPSTTAQFFITVSAPTLTAALVDDVATSVSLMNGTFTNYLLLEVTGDYAAGEYVIDDGTTVTSLSATPVLTDGGAVTYVKVPVPAGVSAGTLTVANAMPALSAEFTADAAGVPAPATLYGTTSMSFSEYYYDVTAGITEVLPASAAFEVDGAVAAPADFITAGTRQQWPANDAAAKVDAISTATYGDTVHFIPTGNYVLNYDDPTTRGEGHEVTAIASVDVGIPVDLLANATLLSAADLATEQSEAVLDRIDSVVRVATSKVYKVKYLRTDAGWGARAATPVSSLAASAWPATPTAETPAYGGNFTNREVSVGFPDLPADLAADSYAPLWDNYLNNLYGGYVEDYQGHREPLVWLQNLFSHKFHDDFEVSLNEDVFGRFSSLDVSEPVTIVIYAKGLEDIVLAGVSFKTFADNDAAIEQGTTHNVTQGDEDSYFDDGQLRIEGVSAQTLADFIAEEVTITKGGAAIDRGLYSVALSGSDVVVSFEPEFFTSPSLPGSYVISLVPATDAIQYKTYSFTVNSLIARPTLAIAGGSASAATEADPATAPQGTSLIFSDEAYAGAVVLTGRAPSTITDVTPEGATAAPAIGAVLKGGEGAGSGYQIDTTALTPGHVYRLNIITTGYVTKADSAAAPSTTAQFFIEVEEGSGDLGESWKRLAGDDRYDTMAAIVAEAFDASDTDAVIVATGENFPDALAASGLAGIADAPVVLTEGGALSEQAQTTIEALEPSTIYIAGGTGSVSAAVEDALKELVDDPAQVIRSAGSDRYQTALDIYAKGKDAGTWGSVAIIASGDNYADALSVSPYSFAEKAPIFLADPTTGLDDATAEVLGDALESGEITRVIIAGGSGSVPDAVKTQLGYALGNFSTFTRLYGADRYGTSVAVADYAEANSAALGFHQIAAATGENFPDALAGGAFAGRIGTVLLLVSDDAAGRTGIDSVVGANSAAIGFGHVLGGEGTVSAALQTALEEASSRA